MDLKLTCWILLAWASEQGADSQPESHLTEKDLVLLAEDGDPKCFTKRLDDFTCFWEADAGQSYDFFYSIDKEQSRCNLTQQARDTGTVLHVCTFPPADVYLFAITDVWVVDTVTNTTTYRRRVSVEDQVLLDPPRNVSLITTGEVGKLLVKWQAPSELSQEICYSSESLQETTKQMEASGSSLLDPLVPGQVCRVQVRVKPSGYSTRGFWSDWSQPVSAMVPQQAEDIALQCHTSDLHHVHCHWNERAYSDANYTLFYKLRSSSEWGSWRACPGERERAGRCVLLGVESSVFQVYLSTGDGPHERTFYSKPLRMNGSVKPAPPGSVREEHEGGRLCLRWDCPLQAIARHLIYQIRYRPSGEAEWKLFTVLSPKTSTCLDVQAGSQYTIQVTAGPNGSVYSGYWSDWSDTLTTDLPSNTGLLFVACVLIMLFILSVAFISVFSRYFCKLKRYLWPPVPNLEKVLESFLTDISGPRWDSAFNTKQCDEDTPASVVEILSEREPPGWVKPSKGSACLLAPETGSRGGTAEDDESPGEEEEGGVDVGCDYVTLNLDNAIPCLRGNEYVYDEATALPPSEEDERLLPRYACSFSRSSTFPACSTDILNRSYLALAEQAEGRGVAGHYTNLENA